MNTFTVQPCSPRELEIKVEGVGFKITQDRGSEARWSLKADIRKGPHLVVAEGRNLTALVNNAVYKLVGDGESYEVNLIALKRFLEHRIRPLMKMQMAELYK